jgi:hypothetical protein
MKGIDPKGFFRKPSSRQAEASCLSERQSAKETLSVLSGNIHTKVKSHPLNMTESFKTVNSASVFLL